MAEKSLRKRKLHIAQLAPPWIRVPPEKYGGIELVVSLLTEKLIERGHEVTLFATGDSLTRGRLLWIFDKPQTDKLGDPAFDAMQVSLAFQHADEFDLIHDHSGYLAVAFASFIKTPILHTIHGPVNDETIKFYLNFRRNCFFNAISNYQKEHLPSLQFVDTVYNAIDVEKYPFQAKKEDYVTLVSRISSQKGTHIAIKVAKQAGKKLILAGKVTPKDQIYFEKYVKPEIDGKRVIYLGEVSTEEKREIVKKAACFIFPVQWPEPFGLVMAEAMAAGTPVVAIRNGSVPEVVIDGKTGFVVNSLSDMVEAINQVDCIDPLVCRRHVERNFSPDYMANAYEKNYYKIMAMTGKLT